MTTTASAARPAATGRRRDAELVDVPPGGASSFVVLTDLPRWFADSIRSGG
jgi:hypothetical protein